MIPESMTPFPLTRIQPLVLVANNAFDPSLYENIREGSGV
jgi:hypothetical protein